MAKGSDERPTRNGLFPLESSLIRLESENFRTNTLVHLNQFDKGTGKDHDNVTNASCTVKIYAAASIDSILR